MSVFSVHFLQQCHTVLLMELHRGEKWPPIQFKITALIHTLCMFSVINGICTQISFLIKNDQCSCMPVVWFSKWDGKGLKFSQLKQILRVCLFQNENDHLYKTCTFYWYNQQKYWNSLSIQMLHGKWVQMSNLAKKKPRTNSWIHKISPFQWNVTSWRYFPNFNTNYRYHFTFVLLVNINYLIQSYLEKIYLLRIGNALKVEAQMIVFLAHCGYETLYWNRPNCPAHDSNYFFLLEIFINLFFLNSTFSEHNTP